MINQSDVVEYLKNVSVIELRGLIGTLEDELGVKIPEYTAPSQYDLGFGGGEVEQTEFTVVLQGFEGKKVALIKVVRALTGLGLKDAKVAVESAPYVIKEGVDKGVAEEVAASMREVGGLVDIV
jgi:large subunit ribosomal protein L7/L12